MFNDETVRRLLILSEGQTEVLKNTLGVVKALTKRIQVLEEQLAPKPPRGNSAFPKLGYKPTLHLVD